MNKKKIKQKNKTKKLYYPFDKRHYQINKTHHTSPLLKIIYIIEHMLCRCSIYSSNSQFLYPNGGILFCFFIFFIFILILCLKKFKTKQKTTKRIAMLTYMDTSTIFLSATGPELQSLLAMDVVGDVEPIYGKPGVIVKLPKFVDDALDAFESLLGDGAGTNVGIWT